MPGHDVSGRRAGEFDDGLHDHPSGPDDLVKDIRVLGIRLRLSLPRRIVAYQLVAAVLPLTDSFHDEAVTGAQHAHVFEPPLDVRSVDQDPATVRH